MAFETNLLPYCLRHNCFDNPPMSPSPRKCAQVKLENFHGKVLKTFDSLPEGHKLKTIIQRCLIIVIAPFVYIALALSLLWAWKKKTEVYAKINPNFEAEFQRLRDAGVLSLAIEREIDQRVYIKYFSNPTSSAVKIILCDAYEIKKTYGNDHYVFTHGQASSWFVVAALIKTLVERFDSSNYVDPSFEYLRSTKRSPSQKLSDIKRAIAANEIDDENKDARISIASVDIHLLSTKLFESALFFFAMNTNMLSMLNSQVIEKTCRSLLLDYLPESVTAKKITDCTGRIYSLAKKINTLCGHLFVICIPKTICKDHLENIGYLSHPYGKPCNCHPGVDPLTILEKLQQGHLNSDTSCKGTYPVPQFRLMTSMVTPNLGVKSFILSPLTTEERTKIYSEINSALTEAIT